MKNLSLGLKISFGFVLLIVIAAALGLMAIWRMGGVETQSTMLAHEYVPEVDVAMELRGAANRLMFEMRGYGFTEDKVYYQKAMEEVKAVEAALQKARDLEARSKNLNKLKVQIDVATKATETYKTLIQETADTESKLDANRAPVLDSSC